jgi:ribose/xylose/arabinose/galactoside ABC-type transport system permease subunit
MSGSGTGGAGAATGAGGPGTRRRRGAAIASALGPVLALLAVWGLFALLEGRSFMSWDNQRLMLLQTAVVGVAAIGATLIIISGGIDLSVGSTIALCTVVVALLLNAGAGPVLAGLGGVATGVACGAAIGAMVIGHAARVAALCGGGLMSWILWRPAGPTWALAAGAGTCALLAVTGQRLLRRLPLSPFIVTLAMWGALRGLAKGMGRNEPVYPEERTWLLDLLSGGGTSRWPMPPGVWMLIGLAILVALVLRATRFGRHVFAVGSSERTARLCGVAVERTRFLVYLIGVGCAGIAGVLQFSYLSMGDPTTAQGLELRVIAAVVIGGASLSGGEGSIRGSLVGAILMTVVDTGCTRLGLDNWVQEIVTGAIIVAAVVIDRLRQRRGA